MPIIISFPHFKAALKQGIQDYQNPLKPKEGIYHGATGKRRVANAAKYLNQISENDPNLHEKLLVLAKAILHQKSENGSFAATGLAECIAARMLDAKIFNPTDLARAKAAHTILKTTTSLEASIAYEELEKPKALLQLVNQAIAEIPEQQILLQSATELAAELIQQPIKNSYEMTDNPKFGGGSDENLDPKQHRNGCYIA